MNFYYITTEPDQLEELDFEDHPAEEQRQISYDEWRQNEVDEMNDFIAGVGRGIGGIQL